MAYPLGEIRNPDSPGQTVLGYLYHKNGLVILGTTVDPTFMVCDCQEWINGPEQSIDDIWQILCSLPESARKDAVNGLNQLNIDRIDSGDRPAQLT